MKVFLMGLEHTKTLMGGTRSRRTSLKDSHRRFSGFKTNTDLLGSLYKFFYGSGARAEQTFIRDRTVREDTCAPRG